jgi:hypothetical protein
VPIDDLIKTACEAVTTLTSRLNGDEDLIPAILAKSATGQGRIAVIAHPFPRQEQARRRFFEKLFRQQVLNGASELAFWYMAWQAKLSDEDMRALQQGLPIQPMSSHPNREEVIYVTCYTAEGQFANLTTHVNRTKNSVSVGDFVRDDMSNTGVIPESMLAAFTNPSPAKQPWWRFGR